MVVGSPCVKLVGFSFIAGNCLLDGSEGSRPDYEIRWHFEERVGWKRLYGMHGIAVGSLAGGLVHEQCQSHTEGDGEAFRGV